MPWTILRPNFFMENFSSGIFAAMIKDQGGIFLAGGDGRTSFISTSDIAEVAAVVFESGGRGSVFNLTGPEALDHTEVAAMSGVNPDLAGGAAYGGAPAIPVREWRRQIAAIE